MLLISKYISNKLFKSYTLRNWESVCSLSVFPLQHHCPTPGRIPFPELESLTFREKFFSKSIFIYATLKTFWCC